MALSFKTMDSYDYKGKRVLVRLDINSPIDKTTKKIVNENRIDKSIPTLSYLIEKGAKIAIIAHQGDTLDYANLISLKEHAKKLSEKLGRDVKYIDDVCGDAAIELVKGLKEGELVILGNLRYLTEEISTFETVVKLTPKQMTDTYLVRRLAPHFDYYVNDAFSAAHRNAPSMVAFQQLLPSASGLLMTKEVSALNNVMKEPARPSVFVLGGAKISDAFGMLHQVLSNGSADKVLTSGVTANVFLLASGVDIGAKNVKFLEDRNLMVFVEPAKEYLANYKGKIEIPVDLAYAEDSSRKESPVTDKMPDNSYLDIGHDTVKNYAKVLESAGTIFVNGPAGVYEDKLFEYGTKSIWEAIAGSRGYSVIGGGDTVTAAAKYVDLEKINYVCTAGGAMVQYLSGKELPLIKAMEQVK